MTNKLQNEISRILMFPCMKFICKKKKILNGEIWAESPAKKEEKKLT